MDSIRAFWLGIFETLLLQKSICGKCSLSCPGLNEIFCFLFLLHFLASRISYTGSISFKTTVIYSRGLGGGGWVWCDTLLWTITGTSETSHVLFLFSQLFYLPCEWCCFPRCSKKKKIQKEEGKKIKKKKKKKKTDTNPRLWVYSRPYRVETGPVLTPKHGPDRMTNKCMGVACRARR